MIGFSGFKEGDLLCHIVHIFDPITGTYMELMFINMFKGRVQVKEPTEFTSSVTGEVEENGSLWLLFLWSSGENTLLCPFQL
jgi:hypothetical protein